MSRRGVCSVCPYSFRVRSSGLIEGHQIFAGKSVKTRCPGGGKPPRVVVASTAGYKTRTDPSTFSGRRKRSRLWCLDCLKAIFCDSTTDLLESHNPKTGKWDPNPDTKCPGSHLPGRAHKPAKAGA